MVMDSEDKLKEIVNSIKKSIELPKLLLAIDNTPCFVKLWKDDSGVCPETECALRAYCKQGYDQLNSNKANDVENLIEVYSEYEHKLGKKSGEKYYRADYVPQGRPVDEFVATLIHSLEYPPILPKNWSYKTFDLKHSSKGPLLISRTASYHAFIFKGIIICRMWTNAAGTSLVDISGPMSKLAVRDNKTLIDIPSNSIEKIKPCTARIRCESTETAEIISKWIKELYDLKTK